MLKLLLVEDNPNLCAALHSGLEATRRVRVLSACASGEAALQWCLAAVAGQQSDGGSTLGFGLDSGLDVVLMDVQLAGAMNGIQAAVALRRELPRLPVVFYSIQDDDQYYRDFRRAGILSHYAYVRKSNYLLPQMVVPLLADAVAGRSFIDPEIEARVHEVSQKDAEDPMALLEPNEQTVVRLVAQGLTNEQIAERLGFHDKRTISRTNGQIYAAWGLDTGDTDEKVARTRAALIARAGRLINWDAAGVPHVQTQHGDWVEWVP